MISVVSGGSFKEENSIEHGTATWVIKNEAGIERLLVSILPTEILN